MKTSIKHQGSGINKRSISKLMIALIIGSALGSVTPAFADPHYDHDRDDYRYDHDRYDHDHYDHRYDHRYHRGYYVVAPTPVYVPPPVYYAPPPAPSGISIVLPIHIH